MTQEFDYYGMDDDELNDPLDGWPGARTDELCLCGHYRQDHDNTGMCWEPHCSCPRYDDRDDIAVWEEENDEELAMTREDREAYWASLLADVEAGKFVTS